MTAEPSTTPADRRSMLRAAVAGLGLAAVGNAAFAPSASAATKPVTPVGLPTTRRLPVRRAKVVPKPKPKPVPPRPQPKPAPGPQVVALRSPLAFGLSGVRTTPEWVMARRVALGSSFVVADQIAKVGVKAWLDAQFAPATVAEPFIPLATSKCPVLWATDAEYQANALYAPLPSGIPAEQMQRVHLLRMALTERHLETAVADFWLDFFSLPWLENKVIGQSRMLDRLARDVAFRTFPEIFTRFIWSPGMLTYLDQYSSTKDHPNENLAREMMELYSVGIGEYTEPDVKAAARLLTGARALVAADGSLTFQVVEIDHYFGPVTIRGRTYRNTPWDTGSTAMADIRQFTLDLATDPAVAPRICRRLAQRFVADEPPAGMITAMVAAWTASGGNIEKVLRTMFAHPSWLPTAGSKWRRPAELWASMAATADLRWTYEPGPSEVYRYPVPTTFDAVLAAGQPLRNWPSPAGMPDENTHWVGTSSVLGGLNFADLLLTGADPQLSTTKDWAARLGLTPSMTVGEAADRVIERVSGFQVAAGDPVRTTVVARLAGGAPAAANLDSFAGVERAVRAVFNSPLMFLR